MWRWFKFKKEPEDSLSGFVNAQKKLGRKIICAGGFKQKIEEEYESEVDQIFKTVSSFLNNAPNRDEIKKLSLIFNKNKGSSAAWLNKRDPTKLVLNFGINLGGSEAQEEIRKVIMGIQMIEPEVKAQPISIPVWESHFQRGLALAKAGKINAAIEEVEKAYQLNEENKAVRYQLALLYFRKGEETRGIKGIEYTLKAHNLEDEGGFDYEWWKKVERARKLKQNVIDF